MGLCPPTPLKHSNNLPRLDKRPHDDTGQGRIYHGERPTDMVNLEVNMHILDLEYKDEEIAPALGG